MKILTFVIYILMSFKSFGQVKEVSQNVVAKDPIYFLDGVQINKNQMFFSPDKIAAINVEKENNLDNGEIYITSKNPKNFNFLTLSQIIKPYLKLKPSSVLFMIDNKILKDEIATYKIDSAYVLSVDVLQGLEIESIKSSSPDFMIVSIKLGTKENLIKSKEVYIKGLDVTKARN